MPESPVTPKGKALPVSSPVGRASQLRKASSSQTLRLSPKSTSSRPRDTDRAEQAGSRRTSESDNRGSRDLRHRSSTSTLSRATTSSFVTSTSGAGTIVGISKDVSANRTVGSGQNAQGRDSNPDQPGRTPLAAISNRTSLNVPARNSRIIQPRQENTTPAKAMFLSLQTSGAGGRPAPEAHAPTLPVLPQLRKLQRQIQTLKAENDELRAIKITQVATIDDLHGQLRAKDAEHARLAEQMRAEAAALKEEKWTLLGRVAELELMQQAEVGEREPGGHEGTVYAASVRSGAPPPSSRGGSVAGRSSIGGFETPGSIYSGRGGADVAGKRSRARSPYHSASSSVVTASARSYVRRRASIAESDLTAASLAEEELDILSDQLVAHHQRHGQEREAMAEQLVALGGDLDATRRQRDRAERRNRDLEARLAAQMALVRHHSMATSKAPAPAPPPPIPDLPVLTYAKVGLVWFDTVMSAFKYWGLSEFISQPDETLFAATDPDREGRRLRAVVLLKRAMDDDILDDIMYLQNQKCITAPTTPSAAGFQPQGLPPEIESPYFLFHTAAILKRTVPSSLTDFGWLDRIGDADFEGIEGFASLVNILNRRHSQLYGTTADHYDALIPKIQENMSRRFPDLEKSLMDPGSAPKKWWHLALWMSRMVKRRQCRISGIDEP
ncbi:hypothetical protein INS49_010974 [Diaporthe citri]|uniref:uncharacterized protein n=1 Tax=Diaporthe citri TaxID=83186 RepID=UPI001C81D188|nr:uncharacterized protein INS49_010974 [Diaporthe citri]KAG6359921.1 hypothetical protein INS49_010974 [Diaporthe citri]